NFHHAGRVDLLENFSVKIPGGKVIALIGESGCGKSTLAKLIAGLYTSQSGNIRYDSYNQQDISLECLRQQVVLVPQDAHFWSRSIIENFRFSYPNVTFEQIVKACQIAGADEFISELPDKYQTVLGEFGANLSGGQKQRLAIARAIVTDPPVLILDESTGALDPVSEARVLEQLLFHRQGKTTIMISHRPKVIRRADWIVMLEKGKLKIQGTVQDLAAQAGDHIDFLDDFIPSAKNLALLSLGDRFSSNGHAPY
ncbi:MAG: ATP-binding cassette domain-containing protein, partial [Cyanobacteria bacterium P01_E01_bin.35]